MSGGPFGGVPSGIPAYAGNRAGRWTPELSAYRLKANNTQHFRHGMANAQSAQGYCDILHMGDSESNGYGTSLLTAWPAIHQGILNNTLGFPYSVGGASFLALPLAYTSDSRWSTAGSWATPALYCTTSTASTTATFVSTNTTNPMSHPGW